MVSLDLLLNLFVSFFQPMCGSIFGFFGLIVASMFGLSRPIFGFLLVSLDFFPGLIFGLFRIICAHIFSFSICFWMTLFLLKIFPLGYTGCSADFGFFSKPCCLLGELGCSAGHRSR